MTRYTLSQTGGDSWAIVDNRTVTVAATLSLVPKLGTHCSRRGCAPTARCELCRDAGLPMLSWVTIPPRTCAECGGTGSRCRHCKGTGDDPGDKGARCLVARASVASDGDVWTDTDSDATSEFGRLMIAALDVLDMCDPKATVKILRQLIPMRDVGEELADAARRAGSGKLADQISRANDLAFRRSTRER